MELVGSSFTVDAQVNGKQNCPLGQGPEAQDGAEAQDASSSGILDAQYRSGVPGFDLLCSLLASSVAGTAMGLLVGIFVGTGVAALLVGKGVAVIFVGMGVGFIVAFLLGAEVGPDVILA